MNATIPAPRRPGADSATPPLDPRQGVAVSVVLPTFNEAGSIRDAIEATRRALSGQAAWEILVVDDDSPDETWRIVDEMSRQDRRVRCHRRRELRGLASAIFDGLALGRGEVLVVMDADLQHDPAAIPLLVAALEEADLAVASRYAPGGSTGSWSRQRRLASRLATLAGRWALGRPVTDPMSGFFAIRREMYQALSGELRPRGFKALLEILSCATSEARIVEVPYGFRSREEGDSKMSHRVVLQFGLALLGILARRLGLPRLVGEPGSV